MATKEITPIQYADYKGWSLQNVIKHLKNGKELDHVISFKRYSRFYLLTVPNSLKVNSIPIARQNQMAKYPTSYHCKSIK